MESPFLTYFLVQMRRLTGCRGQGSLEYIAIAVVLVILVVAAFTLLGGGIGDKADEVGNSINTNCPAGQVPNGAGGCKTP